MLVYGLCLALLFIDTVFTNVCSDVYEKPSHIYAASFELYREFNSTQCRYIIKAPPNHYIVLNFTHFGQIPMSPERTPSGGQKRHPNGSPNCMPRVEVVEVLSSGIEKAMVTVCPGEHPLTGSSSGRGGDHQHRVFQSNFPEVIVTYSWEPGTSSVVQFSIDFDEKTCEFACKDGSCLPESNLVCNSVPDCFDKSDETNCPSTVIQPSITVSGGKNYVLVIVVVVLAIVVLLVVSMCVFNQFRVTSHYLHQHAQLPSDSSERNQLQSGSPMSEQRCHSEVVYVPGAQDRLQHYQQSHEDSSDTTNLPPSIAISRDGEEGYQNSQQLLQQSSTNNEVDRETTVYAPPNRTMCGEQDSPPPYYHRAHSVGHLDKSRISGGRMHRAGRDCRSSPSMPSAHSHYSSTNPTSSSHHHQRNASATTAASTGAAHPPHNNHHNPHHHHHHGVRGGEVTSHAAGLPPTYTIRGGATSSSSIQHNNNNSSTSRLLGTSGGGNTQPAPPATTGGPHTTRPGRLFSAPPSVGGGGGGHSRRVGSGSVSSSSSSTGPPGYPPPEYSDLAEEEDVFGFQQRQSPEAR